MKLKLRRATSILIVLFTLSLTAYACESDRGSKTTLDPAGIDPTVIAMADRILAEQAETSVTTGDNLRVASNSPDSVLSTASQSSLVSKWLEDRALQTSAAADAKTETHSAAKGSHVHYQDIEVDMGGGWCDLCGCWMRHGSDPNGTPQSEIGHQIVCAGVDPQNCWQHRYQYCFSS